MSFRQITLLSTPDCSIAQLRHTSDHLLYHNAPSTTQNGSTVAQLHTQYPELSCYLLVSPFTSDTSSTNPLARHFYLVTRRLASDLCFSTALTFHLSVVCLRINRVSHVREWEMIEEAYAVTRNCSIRTKGYCSCSRRAAYSPGASPVASPPPA